MVGPKPKSNQTIIEDFSNYQYFNAVTYFGNDNFINYGILLAETGKARGYSTKTVVSA